MAIYTPYDEEDDALDTSGLSTSALGQGATRPPAGAAPTATHNPSGPNRFVNFSNYFNANSHAANMAAGGLTGGLDAEAQTTLGNSAKDKATTVERSAVGTPVAPPSDPQARAIEEANREKQAEYGYDPNAYKGPTKEQVGQRYAGTAANAQATTQRINQARDAEGVKALQGGTGFGASLAYAGAGGRLAELRKKYSGLMGQVNADRTAAEGVAGAAETASAANVNAWGDIYRKQGEELAKQEAERLATEADRRAAAAKARAQKEDYAPVQGSARRGGVQGSTNTISEERYALTHGLTWEQWVNAGRPNLDHATPEDIRRLKGGP